MEETKLYVEELDESRIQKDLIRKTEELSLIHGDKEVMCSISYYCLGAILVLSNVIVSSIAGEEGFRSGSPKQSAIFSLSFIASILGVLLNFFKIEQKIQRHHVASFDYGVLCDDLRLSLASNHPIDTKTVLQRKRLIDKHAPLLDKCC